MALITLNVDYKTYHVEVEPEESLLKVLRTKLAIGNSGEFCDTGICGNCTVLLDGVSTQVCNVPAVKVNNANIVTLNSNVFNATQPTNKVNCIGLCLTI